MSSTQNHSAPEGYHTITPSLTVKGGKAAVDYYQRALGATVIHVMEGPGGGVMHAELAVGDSRFMLGDEFPDWGVLSPQSIGGSSVTLHVYVADVDAAFALAVKEGGKPIMEPADQFWGDRMGKLVDPFGHQWSLATRVENLSPEETARRGEEWMKKMGDSA